MKIGPKVRLLLLTLLAFVLGAALAEIDTGWVREPNHPGTFASFHFTLASHWLVSAENSIPSQARVQVVRAGVVGLTLALIVLLLGLLLRGARRWLRGTVLTITPLAFAVLLFIAFPAGDTVYVTKWGPLWQPTWVWEAGNRFFFEYNLGRRTPVGIVSTGGTDDFVQPEVALGIAKFNSILVLSSSFEVAYWPELRGTPALHLGNNPMLLATADAELADRLRSNPSLRELVPMLELGEVKLKILNPSGREDAGGAAGLMMLGSVAQDDRAHIRLLDQVEVLDGDSGQGSCGIYRCSDILEPRTIILVDNFQCGRWRQQGVQLSAVYPAEGVVVLDYPVFFSPWLTGERAEHARRYVDFLRSPAAERMRAKYRDPVCLEEAPAKTYAPATEDALSWQRLWIERTAREAGAEPSIPR